MPSQSINYAALENEISRWMASGVGEFGNILLKIHRFQRQNCMEYDRFCGTKPPAEDWREIPAVPVDVFRRLALRTFPADRTIRTFRTSGTTGEGWGEHHFCSLGLYLQAAMRGWLGAGLPGTNVVGLMAPAVEAPHSSLSQMASWLVPPQRFYFGNWEKLLENLAGNRVVTLFGTALAFLDLFEAMGTRTLNLPKGSFAVETGGYKGTRRDLPKSELYSAFEEKLGLPADAVWNEYGMTELSSQFYSRGLGRVHKGSFWVRALVVDPDSGREVEEGAAGVLRIFDAANLGSVCAIQTRDLAIRRGRDFELLGRDPAALPRGCSRAAEEMLS